MPEIKHTFTGGKMDKDLDERLVKNGEYRDAMNIQVATSEGSDVATAQNILGNEIATTGFIINNELEPSVNFGSNATVVAAIADEINDKLYYLVYSTNIDYIIEYDNQSIGRFVIVDVKATSGGILKFDPNNIITGINIVDGIIFFTDNINEPKKINIQRCKAGSAGLGMTKLINEKAGITLADQIDLEEKHITVIKKAPTAAPSIKLLTGRSNTLGGATARYTAVFAISTPDNLQDSEIIEVDKDNDGSIDANPPDLSGIEANDLVTVEINNILDTNGNVITGDIDDLNGWGNLNNKPKVVIKAFKQSNPTTGSPVVPITDFDLKGHVHGFSSTNSTLDILITSVDGFPGSPPIGYDILFYAIDLYEEDERLFEFKFPRFAYRYKFEDGEYSPFSPFTQVAFAPGSFDYHPRKGYNLGMTNRLSSVELRNIVNSKTPKDVAQIDILFKEEPSPNIYIVESIKPLDDVEPNTSLNTWNRLQNDYTESYTITKEAVKSVVPANQLLRPWDNVPRKALAQEVTASRLIYGNYVQNYDLENNDGTKYVPKLKVTRSAFSDRVNIEGTYGNTKKSVKSLREYQVGVVFGDEYGRETPVLSNTTGTFKIEKRFCDERNQIKVVFDDPDSYPTSLKQFKFFVKETSTEYYNLAMDRYYDAADDNIWLAFPSSDRNKIDIDTFLILKKRSDVDEVVEEPARYKVLAIENQAPDHIKTKKTIISRVTNSADRVFQTGLNNAPVFQGREFKMFYEPFFGTPGQNLDSIRDAQLYVEFQIGDQFSDRYRIASITTDFDKDAGGAGVGNASVAKYSVRVEKSFGSDVNFITDDDTGVSSTLIETTTTVNIYKYQIENRPQFDGRFFAKIYYDEVFRKNVAVTAAGDVNNFRVIASKKIFAMRNDHLDRHTADVNRYYLADKFDYDELKDPNTGGDIAGGCFPVYSQLTSGPAMYGSSRVNTIAKGFGYYFCDPFSAFATFFRRYGAGYDQSWPYILHLGLGSSSNNDYSYKESHGVGDFWQYAGRRVDGDQEEKWSEFGYNPTNGEGSNNSTFYYVVYPGGGRLNSLTRAWWWVDSGNYWPVEARGKGKMKHCIKSDIEVVKDTDVWFVDAGPFLHDQLILDLNFDNSNTGWYSGKSLFNDRERNAGDGIKNVIGNKFTLELGYGGIAISQPDDLPLTTNSHDFPCVLENHYNIGDWNMPSGYTSNALYSTQDITDVTNNLETGSKFRFREDFNNTVYTISGTVTAKGKVRHSTKAVFGSRTGMDFNHVFQDVTSSNASSSPSGDYAQVDKSMAETLSFNYTKNWTLEDIELDDPTAPNFGRRIMQFGEITPGHGGTRIELTACSSSGSISSGNSCLGGGSVHDDLRIFVTGIKDSTSGFNLIEGMAVKKYFVHQSGTGDVEDVPSATTHNGQNNVDANDFLVVRKIISHSGGDYYELRLGGYSKPFLQGEHDNMTNTNGSPVKNKTITFCQVGMNGYSHNSEFNINTIPEVFSLETGKVGAVGFTIEFLSDAPLEPEDILSDNPAIWETEPKETKDLDIYYEATGAIPLEINENNIQDAFPIGSVVEANSNVVVDHDGIQLELDTISGIQVNQYIKICRPDGLTIKAQVTNISGNFITLNTECFENQFYLPYFNCYSFGNGVESNRIRDNFNLSFIQNGVKVSTVLEGDYEEERRKYGLIYSGIYNSISGVNNLNQFIQAEKITKDINPVYGSIQKLHTRDSDLVTLCEDKILKILAQKDALFNADGNTNVTATSNVLGQTIPFGGEYGISKNPESFASEDYRVYFSDKVRGSIMRLSRDGLTPISDAGMKDWFRDHLKLTTKVIGSYDDKKGEYNVKLKMSNSNAINPESITDKVVSFSEKVRGWVSFKSFIDMEFGLSMANNYFTFKEGEIYLHHNEDVDRNTFYGDFTSSSIDVMFNDDPSSIKVYNTLNYEGSQAKIDKFLRETVVLDYQPDTVYHDQDFYNLYGKNGWHVESIITDKEEGDVNEFKEKEGKWFNSINRRIDMSLNRQDTGDFSFQGVGIVESTSIIDINGGGGAGALVRLAGDDNTSDDNIFEIDPENIVSDDSDQTVLIEDVINVQTEETLPTEEEQEEKDEERQRLKYINVERDDITEDTRIDDGPTSSRRTSY